MGLSYSEETRYYFSSEKDACDFELFVLSQAKPANHGYARFKLDYEEFERNARADYRIPDDGEDFVPDGFAEDKEDSIDNILVCAGRSMFAKNQVDDNFDIDREGLIVLIRTMGYGFVPRIVKSVAISAFACDKLARVVRTCQGNIEDEYALIFVNDQCLNYPYVRFSMGDYKVYLEGRLGLCERMGEEGYEDYCEAKGGSPEHLIAERWINRIARDVVLYCRKRHFFLSGFVTAVHEPWIVDVDEDVDEEDSDENMPYSLADRYFEAGRYEEAESLYKQYLDESEQLLGPNHPDTLGQLWSYCEFLTSLGRLNESISLRRRELDAARMQHREPNDACLLSINNLARDLRDVGELQEAADLFQEALAGRRKLLNPNDHKICQTMGGLARTLQLQNKLDSALRVYREQLELHQVHHGTEPFYACRTRLNLAQVLIDMDRPLEAQVELELASATMQSIGDPDDEDNRVMGEISSLLETINAQGV